MDYDLINIDSTINNINDNINEMDAKQFDFDTSILPDCPRHMFNVPRDLSKIAGKSNEEVAKMGIPKYYASQLIGIQQGDYPSVEILQKKYDEMDAAQLERMSDFVSKFMRLYDGKDTCDKEGIKYMAGFLYLYHPNFELFKVIRSEMQQFVSGLFVSDNEILKLASKIVDIKIRSFAK